MVNMFFLLPWKRFIGMCTVGKKTSLRKSVILTTAEYEERIERLIEKNCLYSNVTVL